MSVELLSEAAVVCGQAKYEKVVEMKMRRFGK